MSDKLQFNTEGIMRILKDKPGVYTSNRLPLPEDELYILIAENPIFEISKVNLNFDENFSINAECLFTTGSGESLKKNSIQFFLDSNSLNLALVNLNDIITATGSAILPLPVLYKAITAAIAPSVVAMLTENVVINPL